MRRYSYGWDEMWRNLEHEDPHFFTRDDLEGLVNVISAGLEKNHGVITPKFSFFFTNEGMNNRPRLTLCYISPEEPSPYAGRTVVGMAYCMSVDNPNKSFGKALAFKRAVETLVDRGVHDDHFIREDIEFSDFLKGIHIPAIVKNFVVNEKDFRFKRIDN